MAKELDEIFGHIQNGHNFLLSGGAGSGKTYSLIQVIKRVYQNNPRASIACITYTNVAVNEIKERAPFERLKVATIHDFLWDMISLYQFDLKKALVELIRNGKIRSDNEAQSDLQYFADKKIQYREWKRLSEGVISHDEVIWIAEHLFANSKLLCDIVKDKFDFIFVDEYQDTFPEVIKILLTHLQVSTKANIIGFFGDSMQSIYGQRAENIQSYIQDKVIQQVVKEDNRRNPKKVLRLINQLRNDGLQQKAANDKNAKNFGKVGSAIFLYSNTEAYDIETIRKEPCFETFDFSDTKETKELYLVHNLIATKAGFSNLMAVYDKDQILAYKRRIRKHIREKKIKIEEGKLFGEVIEETGVKLTPKMAEFIENNPNLFEEAKKIPYDIFSRIYLDKDQLIGNKKNSEAEGHGRGERRDKLIQHLFQIQHCISMYQNGDYNTFIKKTNFEVRSVGCKKKLKQAIDDLKATEEKTIGEVIELADTSGIWKKTDQFYEFLTDKEYVYNRVADMPYQEFLNLYNYVEDHTPFSTQHNIKGAEFNNVFVILDNGKWNQYNFEYLFSNEKGKDSVIKRSQKLFYVCCSRAKENLVVYFHKPSPGSVQTAIQWFGAENVIDITPH